MHNAKIASPYPPSPYILVKDGASLKKEIKPLLTIPLLGIDSETSGLDPHKDELILVQIATIGRPVVVIDVRLLAPEELKPLSRLFTGKAIKILQNGKFDLQALKSKEIKLTGPFFDTMLASKILKAGLKRKHSLQALALSLLKVHLDKNQQKSKFGQNLTEKQLQYAADDAAILLELYPILKRRLQAAQLINIAQIEFSALSAVASMEWNGMLLDAAKMSILHQELLAKKNLYREELKALKPGRRIQLSLLPETTDTVNLESPSQVLKALKASGIPVSSTGKKVLIPLQNEYPIIKSLLEYRKYSTLISTFVQGLPTRIHPTTGRIHPNYLQCGTRSGRFSCRKPNLQNIPRDEAIRSCFIAKPGYTIIRADYSQIELRIVAFLSGDRRMVEAYLKGEDLHTLTASLITGKPISEITSEDRRLAKAINFGLIYGMGPAKLKVYAETEYGVIMSLSQATRFRKRFFQAYPGLKQWHEKIKRTVYDTSKRTIRTIHGRRRRWPTNPPLSQLFNHPVQGSNADFLKIALGKLNIPLAEIGALLIGVIHDEIILECPNNFVAQAIEILKRCMIEPASAVLYPVPIEVGIKLGKHWAA